MDNGAPSNGHSYDEVDYLEVCIADVSSVRRCRTFPRKQVAKIVKHGFGLCKAVPFLPCHGDIVPPESKFGVTGEFCVMPDTTTFRKLPWRKNAGIVIGDLLTESGDISPDCPRQVLRKALEMLKEEFDYVVKIGFEIEFVVLSKDGGGDHFPLPLSKNNYGAQNDMTVHAELMEEIAETLEKMNIEVLHFHPESSHGQFELVTGPADPMKACDNLLLTRLAIVSVAHKHGVVASFLPKLYHDHAGSGCHAHMSLSNKDGVDVSQGPTPKALSPEGQFFINGMLKHQAAWMIFAMSVPNSFQRYAPGCWAGTHTIWGVNNREAMIRVLFPTKGVENSIRFEQRCFDMTANPHVGLAALIAAGILGLREKKHLPSKTQVSPASLSEFELEKKEAKRYPSSIFEAISEFHADSPFKSLFTTVSSEDFITATLACRKVVAQHYSPLGIEEEIKALYNFY